MGLVLYVEHAVCRLHNYVDPFAIGHIIEMEGVFLGAIHRHKQVFEEVVQFVAVAGLYLIKIKQSYLFGIFNVFFGSLWVALPQILRKAIGID